MYCTKWHGCNGPNQNHKDCQVMHCFRLKSEAPGNQRPIGSDQTAGSAFTTSQVAFLHNLIDVKIDHLNKARGEFIIEQVDKTIESLEEIRAKIN